MAAHAVATSRWLANHRLPVNQILSCMTHDPPIHPIWQIAKT